MLNNTWMKKEFNRLMQTTRPSRKQGKLIREGRNLQVESLEKRELLAANIFYGNFENTNLSADYLLPTNAPSSAVVVSGSEVPDGAGARAGNSVLKSRVEKRPFQGATVHNSWYRQEVRPNSAAVLADLRHAGDFWYGFSVYVSEDWQADGAFESYAQFRVSTNGFQNPALGVGTGTELTADTRIPGPGGDPVGDLRLPGGQSAPISEFRGVWTDIVLHAKWSTGSDGVYEGWRRSESTGDQYVTLFNPTFGKNINNTTDPLEIPIPRLGLYKSSWKGAFTNANGDVVNNLEIFQFRSHASERTLYYDEWRIASGAGSLNSGAFNLVAPPGSPGGGPGGGPQAPTANDDSASTVVGTPITFDILSNDTDPNPSDTLSVQSINSQPSNGTVVNNGNGTVTFTPNSGSEGTNSTFNYTVSDGNGGTDVGTVSVTVTPVVTGDLLLRYDLTNGSGTSVADQSGNGFGGTLTGFTNTSSSAGQFNTSEGWVSGGGISFLDDSVRSYVETTLPLNTLAGEDATIEFKANYAVAAGYAPAIGSNHGPTFSSPNAFFLGVNNDQATLGLRNPGSGGGGIGSIPWSGSDTTEHHVVVTIDASTNVVETFVDGVSQGTNTRSGTNFNSSANFRIGNVGWNSGEQWDGVITGVAISKGKLTPGSFVLETGSPPVDLPPTASNDSATTTADTAVTIPVLSNDNDPDGANSSLVVQPGSVSGVNSGASVSISGGNLIYTPNPSAGGTTDTFTYQAKDVQGLLSNVATVTVTINSVSSGSIIQEDGESGIDGWTVGGVPGTVTNVVDPTNGSNNVISLQGTGQFGWQTRYTRTFDTPDTSSDSIEWDMRFSEYFSGEVLLDIGNGQTKLLQYQPLGYSPTGTDQRFDVGTDKLNGQWHTISRNLAADLDAVQPGATINSILYFAMTGSGFVDDIKTSGGNGVPTDLPPTANPDSATTAADTAVTIPVLSNDNDPDGANSSLVVQPGSVSGVNSGASVSISGGNLIYTPNPSAGGTTDTFTYQAKDVQGLLSNVATVTVTINSVSSGSIIQEDGESGIDGWSVGGVPGTVSNVVDPTNGSNNVISLQGTGQFGWQTRYTRTFDTPDTSSDSIEWDMRFSEYFSGEVLLDIGNGQTKLLQYQPLGYNPSGADQRFDIGTDKQNGQWHTISRNLAADLEAVQPGATINSILYFAMTGSGLVDDIKTLSGVSASLAASSAAGDLDADGDVDGSDFLAWQRGASFAPSGSSASTTNALSDWQGNYGTSSVVAAATASSAQVAAASSDSTEAVASPAFLLTADMFSPVASQPASDSVLDEAFADNGESASVTQQSQPGELDSDVSTILAEEAEEEESEDSFADSLDLAFQLL